MFHKYTLKKQELIAVEFAKLIAFNFVGGKPNIKMVWTIVSKKSVYRGFEEVEYK